MTPEPVRQLGAETFRDSQGTKRFGLPEVDFLPGKHFWVDLGFYSHIQLAFIMISMESLVCAENEYVALLNDLREKHGKEREAKNLDYPNARFLSHTWAFGITRIELNYSCSKPGSTYIPNFIITV